jgi:catechol 2,3-dioxygenase-like lactoylglutathione lyase family enzyme
VARLVGINHVAIEVGDLGEALAFFGRIFDLELRGRAGRMAFVDMGDQFLALSRDGAGTGRRSATSASSSTTGRARSTPRGRPARR